MSGTDESEEFREAGDAVYEALLSRIGEGSPRPRLEPTRRAVELLGDPQRAYPILHIAGTNGKTSTSRIAESILRAYGLRTGLLTSPHLERFNERILIDGVPISDESLAVNWADIEPYLEMVDDELVTAGESPLTFFEALTVLAFAVFADAPVDVAVVEVGMGGEWDSTNVADGDVAVITPIDLDHTNRLGSTVTEIARTKSGIIKPASSVVSARQTPDVLAVLENAAELTESTLAVEGDGFELLDARVAVGGQMIDVRGIAGEYRELYLPLHGVHQAQNAVVAIAAVESFLGGGGTSLSYDALEEGLASVTSPGRLHLVGIEPSVLVDAAHNPHGAAALVAGIGRSFDFDEIGFVFGALADKDVTGILTALAPAAAAFFVTTPDSDRALSADSVADLIAGVAPSALIEVVDRADDALVAAREWAASAPRRAVVVTGSIVLVGEAITVAEREGWMSA
ncbi:bifunctional folylpolyglutamate synthase/dihydrofolate synthase [Agromyces atrinae]|uniref:tetrahydrofolate synthase n=1 Tax=Agromyces atrinae TaxID=592376 RepID=A0A4Q2MBV0_9MICO|nr:folylpolyglutamate synthase/dihydrofolate synthase family protein [Agromyces atrinae]NYD66202.1 dihydrofolate synthase/folylpolyglutamate synthase [Agromyces atrinae]RXZ86540.1 bifunctional folylpolyglutamate synthase/dihydrofolate synthase [Agromyces atrinae]